MTAAWNDGRIEGSGTAVYANGVSYTGEFLNALSSWAGRDDRAQRLPLTRASGRTGLKERDRDDHLIPTAAVYTGQFADGQRSGTGRLEMASGVIYEGEWADGQINGQGVLTQPNGDVYTGVLVDGPATGRGPRGL